MPNSFHLGELEKMNEGVAANHSPDIKPNLPTPFIQVGKRDVICVLLECDEHTTCFHSCKYFYCNSAVLLPKTCAVQIAWIYRVYIRSCYIIVQSLYTETRGGSFDVKVNLSTALKYICHVSTTRH